MYTCLRFCGCCWLSALVSVACVGLSVPTNSAPLAVEKIGSEIPSSRCAFLPTVLSSPFFSGVRMYHGYVPGVIS